MLSSEENELVTRTGPGTPGGELLRRYWQPVALCEELPVGGPPKEVRLLGEDLVLFRDDRGRPGLLGIHCSHRGADLSYGRVEDGGLRCVYHGWLYDVHGRCLEQPAEPKGSQFNEKIRHLAYPCQEAGGLILAYMGPGEPPLLPAYPFLLAPEAKRVTYRVFQECNYLQGNEGDIDPSHVSYLHRFFEESGRSAVVGSNVTANTLVTRDSAPRLEVEETDFGLRIFALRKNADNKLYVRISNFILPNLAAFSSQRPAGDGYGIHWHVPIDDTSHWKFGVLFSRTKKLEEDERLRAMDPEVDPVDHGLKRNKANRYLQSRQEMKEESYVGMGRSFLVHDACVTEGQGPIQNRSAEHLGYGDKAIIAQRKLLLRAVRAVSQGHEPAHVIRNPTANQFLHLVALGVVIPDSQDWRTVWNKYPQTLS